ncbi:uncharacterized protein Bfra_006353 [Botrytis fragariae]|uniref:Myb-like DNA-binding domain-containing protein n=1 Tax=Botrytis fragariae TaxID=1964551 RepID=A0A8H6EP04_9HELO|nr:uncharacterized protein Bfra_006353 [Botrytis fragariae]KAF5879149.1 hypothetical protein Bfra_006353 [Botrytis fragariae]
MPPKSENPLTDNEKFFAAVFSQLLSDVSKLPKLNNAKLAEDLALPTPDAARVRWARIVAKIRDGNFGDLKIGSAGNAQKRSKEETGIEDRVEGLNDVVSPTKKQKTRAPRKKAGDAGGKAEKEIKEEKFMNEGEGSGFEVFEDSDLIHSHIYNTATSSAMTRSDNIKLLIAVFKQWQSARIDTIKLGEDLGINPGAAGTRLFRLKARLRTGDAPTHADKALLIAIISQERRLPRLDYTLLGADLKINPGAAAMRWWRYKIRLEEDTRAAEQQESERRHPRNDPAENLIASEKRSSSKESGVFGWPYNEKGWPDVAWEA